MNFFLEKMTIEKLLCFRYIASPVKKRYFRNTSDAKSRGGELSPPKMIYQMEQEFILHHKGHKAFS